VTASGSGRRSGRGGRRGSRMRVVVRARDMEFSDLDRPRKDVMTAERV